MSKFLDITGLTYFKQKQDAANAAKFALQTSIPTKVSDLANDSQFQTLTEVTTAINNAVTSVYRYKGSVASVEALPTGAVVGDVYNVGGDADGMNYAWTGTKWDALGQSYTLSWDNITGKPTEFNPAAHVHDVATTDTNGFMSSAMVIKLAGIAENANNYVLPKAAADTLGGVKVGTNLNIDSEGVLSAVDTTYNEATQGTAGLMSAADKKKLDGIAENANKYELPAATASTLGGVKVGANLAIDGSGVLSATYSYTHPDSAAGAKTTGLYKVGTDAQGHVIEAVAVVKEDITALGIPAQDTTYEAITTSEIDGLF